MKGYYLEAHEIGEMEKLLSHSIQDTINCWVKTRLLGISASMAVEGNVSVPLLHAFDDIAEEIRRNVT